MHRSQKGTRFAQVKDVSSCFFPRSNGHAKPRLGAAAQKKNQQQNWNRNPQQPQQNVASSRHLFRSIEYFHFCISFPHHFVSAHEIALARFAPGPGYRVELINDARTWYFGRACLEFACDERSEPRSEVHLPT